MCSFRGKLDAVCIFIAKDVAGKFYDCHLHSQADSKVWDLVDTGVLCGQDHAFGSSSAEAAWYQDSVYAVKSLVQVFLIEFFGINPGDLYFCLACDSAVLQGFYDA